MRYALTLLAAMGLVAAAPCTPTIYPPAGSYLPLAHLGGPGLLLDGGGDIVPAALIWMRRRLTSGSAHGGNVVVLRASGDSYDDPLFYGKGGFASVRTILVPPCTARSQVDELAPLVDGADAVYFAGGDQAHYAIWKGSALIAAVQRVYARGGIVGGLSAGLAIQGAVVYDSVAADRLDAETRTSDAVADPLEPRISFTTGLFSWRALRDTITDTHFAKRDRFGRLVVFLARILHERLLRNAGTIYGLGIDQGSAVVVDAAGTATVLNGPGGRGAYLVRANLPVALAPGRPLRFTVEVSHVARSGERFDLLRKATREPWRAVTVDGSKHPPYSSDPYS
jgi:cyanophycinase-like exopeptidase